MRIVVGGQQQNWLYLPPSFPTPDGELPREWENRVIQAMSPAWRGGLHGDREQVVRAALQHGLNQVDEADAITFQFWPNASVANVVVHILAVEGFEAGSAPSSPLDGGLPYATQPVVTTIDADGLGTGLEARYLLRTGEQDDVLLGGMNLVFSGGFGVVGLFAEPTLPRVLGLMMEPLRELARSIRMLDDEDRPVVGDARAEVGTQYSRGDEWAFEQASR